MNGQKLKIAFTIDHFLPQRGGAERYLCELVAFLLARGHEVHVFAMNGQNIEHTNFHFHRIPVIPVFRWLKSLSFVIGTMRAIKMNEYDIVQVLGKNLKMNVFQPHGGLHRASFRQNVLASSEHSFVRGLYRLCKSFDLKHLLFLAVERAQLHQKENPEILAISKMVACDIQHYFKIPDDKIHLVYNGVDTKRFSLAARTAHRDEVRASLGITSQRVLLFVGNNFKLKGLRYFILTLEKLKNVYKDTQFKALIIGKGKKGWYEKFAERRGIKDDCIFLDSVDKIEKYYGGADILVQPTFYDPCSLAVMEALATGLPVITTRFNGAGELIDQGNTGFVVDNPRCVSEMARWIHHFFSSHNVESVARKANDTIKQYDNQIVHNKILEFYYSLVDKRNGAKI